MYLKPLSRTTVYDQLKIIFFNTVWVSFFYKNDYYSDVFLSDRFTLISFTSLYHDERMASSLYL